jgi:hypothetical protein
MNVIESLKMTVNWEFKSDRKIILSLTRLRDNELIIPIVVSDMRCSSIALSQQD